jgi:hypothetical protein
MMMTRSRLLPGLCAAMWLALLPPGCGSETPDGAEDDGESREQNRPAATAPAGEDRAEAQDGPGEEDAADDSADDGRAVAETRPAGRDDEPTFEPGALDAAIERIEALEAEGAFADAWREALEARTQFARHPDVAKLDAVLRRLKEEKRQAARLRPAVQRLGAETADAVEVAAKLLLADDVVGTILLRNAVLNQTPRIAANAAMLLVRQKDPLAPELFWRRLREKETDERLAATLLENMAELAAEVDPKTQKALWAVVAEDDAHEQRDVAGVLIASVAAQQADAETLGRAVGDPGAFEKLQAYVRTALESGDAELIAWGRRHAAAFDLVVGIADLKLWLRADQGVTTDAEGRIARWADSSPSGWDAVQTESKAQPTLAADPKGVAAVSFDGEQDWMKLPAGFKSFPKGLTLCAWIKPLRSGSWERVLDLGNGQEADNILFSRYENGRQFRLSIYQGGSRPDGVHSKECLVNDQWQHIAAVQDAEGDIRLYHDGEVVGKGAHKTPRDVLRKSNLLGRSNWGGADALFKGFMDDIRVYDRALTEQELTTLRQRSKRATE